MLPFQAEEKERRHPPPFLEGASNLLSWDHTQLGGMGGGHVLAKIEACVYKEEVREDF